MRKYTLSKERLLCFIDKHIYIIAIVLSLPAFIALIQQGYFFMQDDLQAFRLQQMSKCFEDMQIPCRWVPDAGYQYGYPMFNFYAPLVYYLGQIFIFVNLQIIDTVKVLFVLGFIFSALGMYLLVREFYGKWPALVASLLYVYAPFRAVQVYVRGSLSEFFALVFLPFLFLFSYRLIIKYDKLSVVFLAISLSGLFTTHVLLTLIFVPFFFLWSVYWLVVSKFRHFKDFLIALSIGCLLSAYFILPMILEKKYVHAESLLSGYFDYRRHFVSVKQLFFSNDWGYGSSDLGSDDDLSLSVGLIHWVVVTFGVIWGTFVTKESKHLKYARFLVIGMTLLVIIMMHIRSIFIWENVRLLHWLQFPWRFLSLSTFFLSFLSAFTIYQFGKYKIYVFLIISCLVFVLYLPFFQPKEWYLITDKEKFSGKFWEKQLTISIFDYLPVYADLPPQVKAPDFPEILDGNVEFLSYIKKSNYQTGEIIAEVESTLRVPIFDFPGMEVFVNNSKIPHRNDDCRNQDPCLGLVTFDVPKGEHQIKIVLNNTPVRQTGNFLTATGFVLLVVWILRKQKGYV